MSNLWRCIPCPEWREGGERRGEDPQEMELEPSRLSRLHLSLLQCQTVTNQSTVGAVSTAATVQSSVCESQISLNKERPGWYLTAQSGSQGVALPS